MVCEQLPKAPTAPAQARHLLDCLDGRVDPERLDDARLLISEVVTNAVEHVDVDGDIEVSFRLSDDTLRVEVVDPGLGFRPSDRDPASHRGWGLRFVQRLSERWGVGEGVGRVWFELPR